MNSSYTSKTEEPVEKRTHGMEPSEVNICVVYSLYNCGGGILHTGLETKWEVNT